MRKILVFCILLGLSGCGGDAVRTRASIPDGRSAAERAEVLSWNITQIEDVEKASVVITGNTAIVGIAVAGELDDPKLMRLKSKVEKEVKRLDPGISHVAVTASAELVERINNLADSVAEDTPPELPPELERVIEGLTPPL